MSGCLLQLTLFLAVSIVQAQNATVLIHIKLIDGRTGQPIKDEQVGLENRADYREISVRTNQFDIASLNINRDAVNLVHNTDKYVNCGDERGGSREAFIHPSRRKVRIVLRIRANRT